MWRAKVCWLLLAACSGLAAAKMQGPDEGAGAPSPAPAAPAAPAPRGGKMSTPPVSKSGPLSDRYKPMTFPPPGAGAAGGGVQILKHINLGSPEAETAATPSPPETREDNPTGAVQDPTSGTPMAKMLNDSESNPEEKPSRKKATATPKKHLTRFDIPRHSATTTEAPTTTTTETTTTTRQTVATKKQKQKQKQKTHNEQPESPPLTSNCAGDLDIKNSPGELELLRGCRVVEGNLCIVLMEQNEEQDFRGISFPELIEVTGYVLFSKVKGLVSLGQLFPNLSLIRGTSLVDGYALIVFDMPDLEELRLTSLRRLLSGTVRIENNPKLCFADTLDWDEIAPSAELPPFLQSNGQHVSCPNCTCETGRCWGARRCRTPSRMVNPANNMTCHRNCAVGCIGTSSRNCTLCAGPEERGDCIDQCPPGTALFQGRRCIANSTCELNQFLGNLGGVVFRGKCIHDCPPGFMRNNSAVVKCRACTGPCRDECHGMILRSVRNATGLKGCIRIEGTLEIEIPDEQDLEGRLERHLGNIRVITGSLVISRTRSLSSLSFLRSLRSVEGRDPNKKFDVFVNDNDNLQYLFDWGENSKSTSIKLRRGAQVIFYYNPRLCPQEIDKFARAANLTEDSVLTRFNGFINPCGSRNLSSTVSVVGPESAVLTWRGWEPAADLIGYAVFVSPATHRDITEYAGADLCHHDTDPQHGHGSWTVLDVRFIRGQPEVSQLVPRLRPATQYAYYIKTYTTQGNVNSPIKYFRTRPDRPSPPSKVRVSALRSSSGSLLVAWDPPFRTNGALSHYVVTGTLRDDDDMRQVVDRDYCEHPFLAKSSGNGQESVASDTARHWLKEDPFMGVLSSVSGCCCSDCCRVPLDEEQCERLLRGSRDVVDACGLRVDTRDSLERCSHILYTVVSENLQRGGFVSFPKMGGIPDRPSLNLSEEWHSGGYGSVKRRFVRVEPATASGTVVGMLAPFGLYTVQVHACGYKDDGDPGSVSVGSPLVTFCSAASVAAARTTAISDADEATAVNATLNDGGLNVTWKAPQQPNGMIVAYLVRFKDPQETEAEELCFSQQHYRRLNGVVHIPLRSRSAAVSLDQESSVRSWAVQVRVVSLAGPGSWVDANVHFPVIPVSHQDATDSAANDTAPESHSHSTKARAIAVVVVLLLILVLLAVLLVVLKRRRDRAEDQGDAGRRHVVNPDLTDCWDIPDNDEDWPRVFFQRDKDRDSASDRVTFSPLPAHLPAASTRQADVAEDDDDGLWLRWPGGSAPTQPSTANTEFALPPPPKKKQAGLPQSQDDVGDEVPSPFLSTNPFRPSHCSTGNASTNPFLNFTPCDPAEQEPGARDDPDPVQDPKAWLQLADHLPLSGGSDTKPDRKSEGDKLSLVFTANGDLASEQECDKGYGEFEIMIDKKNKEFCSTDSFSSVNLSESEDTNYLLQNDSNPK